MAGVTTRSFDTTEADCVAFRHALEQVGPGPALGSGLQQGTARVPEVSAEHGCPCVLCGKYGCSCPKDPEKE